MLRLSADLPAAPGDAAILVTDAAWTSTASPRNDAVVGIRDVAGRILSSRDLIAETCVQLDEWAATAGVVDAMTIGGTSFWYQARQGHWMWLQEMVLSLSILDEVVRDLRPASIDCTDVHEPVLLQAARLIAQRDGLPIRAELASTTGSHPMAEDPDADSGADSLPERGDPAAGRGAARAGGPAAPAALASPRGPFARLRRRLVARLRPDERVRRRRYVARRLRRLSLEKPRLLVVLAHVRQRVEAEGGRRLMDPYLGPIVDRLRGTQLEPIEVDLRLELDDAGWARLVDRSAGRLLPGSFRALGPDHEDLDALDERAARAAAAIERAAPPLVVCGVDVGPVLAARVAADARRRLPRETRTVARIRSLVRALHPAAILLADEYHRQDWLGAARSERVRTIAVQHGLIYRWHRGYIHDARPPALALPDRTYVFGDWERRLLTSRSVYRDDEVRVGGSPRLDVVPVHAADAAGVRAELGVAPGDRLVVLSGTWGGMYRRFYYPIALARLFDRRLPAVHLVVKLHPSERDEGPYRAVIEGVAAAGKFAPPPITVVQDFDLYRLLAAADAHLGIHSTVLTEAVAAGTPNLLAGGLAEGDILGYVAAGVAIPVSDGGDLLDALDAASRGAITDEARAAFLKAHFEPGSASERIAGELLAWLD